MRTSRVLVALTVAVTLALPGVFFDQTLNSIIWGMGWPPDDAFLALSGQPTTGSPAWFALGLAGSLATALLTWCLTPFVRDRTSARWVRMLATASGVILVGFLLVPPVGVYLRLMNPLPIPKDPVPVPNGYDDLLAAAQMCPQSPTVNRANFDAEVDPLPLVRSAAAEMSPVLERVREGMSKETWKEVEYKLSYLMERDFSTFRMIARTMLAVGELAEREGRVTEASDQYLELMTYGNDIARGGLMVDSLVGIACAGIGCSGLYSVRDLAPNDRRPSIVDRIGHIESELESVDAVFYRDRVWTQRTFGWHGHLTQILMDFSDDSLWSSASYRNAYLRHVATLRLLQLDYALRVYRADHGQWPAELEQLVPSVVASVPVDPFSPEQGTLRYQKTEEGYLLYSVSQNGVDDNGRPHTDVDGFGFGWAGETGDFRLDLLYAPEPTGEEPGDAGLGDASEFDQLEE